MASFEEAAVVERATGVVRVKPEQEAALGDSSSSRASDQQHERGRECSDGGDNPSQRWTRSQSPLRQLLSSASSSRPGSPKTGNGGLGNGIGGGGDGGGSAGGMQPISSLDSVHEEALGVLAGAAASAKPCNTPPSDDIERAAQHKQRQQQPQQQRVCVKNVLRPVSYDECHIPSEDGQDDGGDDGNVNPGNISRPLPTTAVSSDPVPSVRQPS